MITTAAVSEFAAEVRRDLQLTPKQLQSKYLYDPLGSSLFEAICRLPWYRITRAENRLLISHAGEIVAALGPDPATVVELGPGSGEKLAVLAEALQSAGSTARVHIIDISSQALEQTEQRLTRLQHVSVVGHQSTYEVGLRRAAAARDGDGPMLVLLLGSNVGNFDTPAALAFLRGIQQEPARPNQSRARGNLQPRRFRSSRHMECHRTADRNASRQPCRPDRTNRGRRSFRPVRSRRTHLDGEFVQIRARSDRTDGC
jgi:uncharacterized SAM-dependent methyltransferase